LITGPQRPGLARLRRLGFWLEYASMARMTAEAAVVGIGSDLILNGL
jgi:hypothetical protein